MFWYLPPYQGYPYFIEECVNISSKDKVWKKFAARMKLISLPKSLGGCSINTIKNKCHNDRYMSKNT